MVRKRDLVVSMIYFALWLDVQVSAVKSADDFEDFRRRMTPFKTRVYNQNQQIKKWPNNKVYFYIDPGYTLQEEQLIRMSILRVVSDIHNCVIFVEVPASDPRYKVKITPFQNDGVTPESFCYTYPGVYAAGKASGALEQRAVLARGKSGCLDDGSIHRVMKFFGLLLGLRNVHQRPDRDNYIEIQRNYVLPGMLEFGYRKYSTEEALMVCPYDYCSITHNIEADFAANGPAFTVKQPPFFIPQLDRLSECDCQEISAGYGCNAKECSPLDCAAQVRPAMPPAVTQPPAPVPFSTQSSLTSVITSVTSSDKETTICYSVPNTQAPTEFSVKTTLSPTTLDRDASKTTCSIVAGVYNARRKPRMGGEHFRVINADPKYKKWPDNTVPYYIDKAYTSAERGVVEGAIKTVMQNMKGCVEFVEVPQSSDEYKLKITPFAPDGKTEEKQCSSYPGVYADHAKKSSEQAMVLARGSDGCLGGTHHNILKYFAIALGKRTEHQRPDRDAFIEIVSSGIAGGMAFAYDKYDWGTTKNKHAYDLCSVTHNQQTVFAKPGQVAFTVKNPPYRIPMLNRLSEMDCREISEEYGCDADRCDPLKCEEQTLTSTTSTTTSSITSTTVSSTVTTVASSTPNRTTLTTTLPASTTPSKTTVSSALTTPATSSQCTTRSLSVTPSTVTRTIITTAGATFSMSLSSSTSAPTGSSTSLSSSVLLTTFSARKTQATSTMRVQLAAKELAGATTQFSSSTPSTVVTSTLQQTSTRAPPARTSSLLSSTAGGSFSSSTTTSSLSSNSPRPSTPVSAITAPLSTSTLTSTTTTTAAPSASTSSSSITVREVPTSTALPTSLLMPTPGTTSDHSPAVTNGQLNATEEWGTQVCYHLPLLKYQTVFAATINLSNRNAQYTGSTSMASTCVKSP
ncbi:hypothetical protein RvY_04335-1 [Ramazzottius varieornatus]|uniref:Peptidase M12A domain-containing protein n=1 Tax=Ramazzottius varieornatus TaxID=947166 RepID=A0A1D1UUU9_RAMVA|nr:hypothetical protein RvY_04335-1 [Ramazzottius varieornatus]